MILVSRRDFPTSPLTKVVGARSDVHEPPEQALDFADFLRFLGSPDRAHPEILVQNGWERPAGIVDDDIPLNPLLSN